LLLLLFQVYLYFQGIIVQRMHGVRSKALTDPSTTSHQTAGGLNVTTGSANIGDKKAVILQNLLQADPQAADIKFSFFVAACQSYRYDSCLKPFPPQFIKDGIKDIDALVCENL
jgi:hypothetical protein